MSLIDDLAEQRIREAMEQGAFDDLPGQGQPLELDDDSHVPEHLRAGYRLLKNAGYLPPELEWSRALREVEDLLDQLPADAACEERQGLAARRLHLLQLRLGQRGGSHRPLWLEDADYRERVLRRLGDE